MAKTYALKCDEKKFQIDLIPFKDMNKFEGVKKLNNNTIISCDINLLLNKINIIKSIWVAKNNHNSNLN